MAHAGAEPVLLANSFLWWNRLRKERLTLTGPSLAAPRRALPMSTDEVPPPVSGMRRPSYCSTMGWGRTDTAGRFDSLRAPILLHFWSRIESICSRSFYPSRVVAYSRQTHQVLLDG